jgi:DNA-directed RNA polymerase subunit RPC12/RpoP
MSKIPEKTCPRCGGKLIKWPSDKKEKYWRCENCHINFFFNETGLWMTVFTGADLRRLLEG